MPRIVKKAPRKEYKVVCKVCEYTIAYFKDEVKSESGQDPWGYSWRNEFIRCPHCKQDIILKSRG